jgi:hypothetical protein
MSSAITTADTPTEAGVRRLTWRRLLSVAAAANLTAVLLFAAAAGDLEAAAIGTVFAVGLALLHWRTGLAGKLLIAASLATRRG